MVINSEVCSLKWLGPIRIAFRRLLLIQCRVFTSWINKKEMRTFAYAERYAEKRSYCCSPPSRYERQWSEETFLIPTINSASSIINVSLGAAAVAAASAAAGEYQLLVSPASYVSPIGLRWWTRLWCCEAAAADNPRKSARTFTLVRHRVSHRGRTSKTSTFLNPSLY